jgi:SAM-dependent methyltransferase
MILGRKRVQPYTNDYYCAHRQGAQQSARVLVPMVLRYVHSRSVIDVGCGQGTWLSVFREHGVEDVWGVDGSHVDERLLEIPAQRFLAADLSRPLSLKRRFDLVVSLEVAEHLPADCADDFVESLTRLGPVVLFSAAIPYQGGACHLNEQWPSYWANRFHDRGYEPVDCLRRHIWEDRRVEWWYAQNALFYVERGYLDCHPLLQKEYEFAGRTVLPLVHPKRFLEWVEWGKSQSAEKPVCQAGASLGRETSP